MEFGILGRLSVRDEGGTELAIPAARQRVLLAALLLQAGRVVPVDRLVDTIWDGAEPKAAHKTVRSYVQRLRAALGPEGAARIVTRDPGYLIRIEDGELDHRTAQALGDLSQEALGRDDWESARTLALRALSLWRDDPLIDVGSRTLRDAWSGPLEELRLRIVERRIEAEVRLGLAESLLPELAELIGRHPLRERLRALHMSALAQAGRRADALSAYLDARTALIEFAGIEPGAELQAVHRRILDDDRPSMRAVANPDRDPEPVPVERVASGSQLPADTRLFTGREIELRTLMELAEDPAAGTAAVAAIDGMGGTGKTVLAVHAAHLLRRSFPDGQLFVDLHGHTPGVEPLSPGAALEWLLRSLGVAPARIPSDPGERAALFRARLDGTSTLIVLDDAVGAAQVRPLLPGAGRCLVLITSRRRLTGLDEAAWLSLDSLPEPRALDLLCSAAGPGRLDRHDPDVARLAALCGRLPLALRIVASRLRSHPALRVEELLIQLADEGTRLGRLRDDDRDPAAVVASSLVALPSAEQRVFRLLGHVAGLDFDAGAATALAGDTDRATVERLLASLRDHSLLGEREAGRYRFHDLVRLYARELANADPDVERRAVQDRLSDFYLAGAAAADRFFVRHARPWMDPGPVPAGTAAPEFVDRAAAQAWMRAERGNLLAAAYA